MRRRLYRAVYALTWHTLGVRVQLARRINEGGADAELACYVPWLLVSGVGILGLRAARSLADA